MVHRSIRFKIIFWFVLLVAAILSIFSFLVYFGMRYNLFEHTDDILELKAEGIVGYIDVYWHNQKVTGANHNDPPESFFKNYGTDFIKTAEHWVTAIPEDPELANIAVSLYDAKGTLLITSKKEGEALSKQNVADVLNGEGDFTNYAAVVKPGQVIYWRTFIVPVVENGRTICIVKVEKTLTFVQVALSRLRVNLLIFSLASLAVAFLTGFFLSGIILGPLKRIIDTVKQITADNLHSRINLPDTRDEVKNLADTFNKMLDELEKSFLTQSQIIQDVSHELRTPLTIIKGEMEVALKKVRSSEEYKTTLESSLEEVDRISRIVEHLLLLARFDSNQAALNFAAVGLTLVVRDAVNDATVLARSKNITIGAELAENVFVSGDEMHLRRAILNILDNAVKYTNPNGTIRIALEWSGGQVLLSVEDNGIGISEQDLPHIFDRFYRADASRSSSGFGLGLSLAKTIIEAHGGEISAISRPALGTTIRIFLPILR